MHDRTDEIKESISKEVCNHLIKEGEKYLKEDIIWKTFSTSEIQLVGNERAYTTALSWAFAWPRADQHLELGQVSRLTI